ncbi:MAG TPA: polyprenol phosphomannose-dependent alpha 1,6 mannosyltransferase MptB, partial [Ktedonobacterales bacterium]|nr:polyprenol phosphomannose-dependent alpha 1,6 mannosyltransferase MptB [Ktedonobacterales bacterium]
MIATTASSAPHEQPVEQGKQSGQAHQPSRTQRPPRRRSRMQSVFRDGIPNTWRRLARSAPPIPGFNPRSEDVFAHLFSQVPATRMILVAGISSAIMYLGFVVAFPLLIFWNQPHVGRESSIINDLGAITGYNPLAALAFVSAVLVLLGCQFMALLAVGRVQQAVTAARGDDTTTRRAQRAYRSVRLMTLGFPLVFAAIMIFMQPVTTTDLYGYVARGYLFAHLGQNPMVAPAYQLPGGLSVDRPASPYGPLWLLVTGAISWLCGENLLANMLIYKVIGALGVVFSLYLIDRLGARLEPARRLRIDALFGWSPLLLFEAVGNGHNDIIMMLCVLLALTCMLRGRAQLALAFLVLGALIKYASAVLVPLWLVYELRHHVRRRAASPANVAQSQPGGQTNTSQPAENEGRPIGALADAARRIARNTVRAANEVDRWAAFKLIAEATLIGGVMTIACYAPFWEGLQTFTGLGQQLRPLYYNDSVVAFVTGPLQLLVPANEITALDKTVRLVFYTLFAIYTTIQAYRLWLLGPHADLQDFITAAAKVIFASLVLITFWFQPWYVVWLIALAPLAREPFVRRQATIFGAGALLTYAISAYVLIGESGVIRNIFVQLFEIVITFGPLLILRAAPYEDGWVSIVRRYLGMLGEGTNRHPVFFERIMLALVLIVAALLRLLGLGSLIGQIPTSGTEVATLRSVSADLRLFLSDPRGLNGPFVAVQGLLVRLFGPTPLAALLPSAVIGTLTVFIIYLLAEELMRQGNLPGHRVVGILAALLAATSSWHVSLSRSGMEVVLLPLLMCLAVYCLLVAFRLRRESLGLHANPAHAVRRRTRRSLAWALRHNPQARMLYRGVIAPLRRQYLHGQRRRAELANTEKADVSSLTLAKSPPASVLGLYAAAGAFTGLACDLEPGLWIAPVVVIGFLLVWRWRQPQAFTRMWLGLLTLTGATVLAGIPSIWYFVSQGFGFPKGSAVLARSSVAINAGPSIFTLPYWERVAGNLGGAIMLLISQDYSAGYPAVGGAQIIPAVLGPFFLLGILILLVRLRNPTMLATLLLIILP